MVPASAMHWAVSIFTVVLLPAPFGPRRPTHVPSGTSRSSPVTACTSPNDLRTPRSRNALPTGVWVVTRGTLDHPARARRRRRHLAGTDP